MIRPLFVLGASRSGTTALTNYMNEHEEILLCMERYKYVPEIVTPEVFTYQRILDYEPQRGSGETNIARERHEDLLTRKDPAKLKWIGDKGPGNAKRYRKFSENNPGAHFLITYRPIEEVVESFEERSRESKSPVFAGKDGLEMGVAAWNRAMQSAREYLESYDEPNGLIVSYHDFFSNPRDYGPLLSEFLEIYFDDSILEAWASTSREFEGSRREKEPLAEEKAAYIEENKDHATEEWVLERIERQWYEPGLYKRTVGEDSGRRKLAAALMRERTRTKATGNTDHGLERDIKRLENKLTRERRNTRTLRRENRDLDQQIDDIQASRSWRLLSKLQRLRSAILETRSRAVRNSGARRVLAKLARAKDTLSRGSKSLAKGIADTNSRSTRQEAGREGTSVPEEPAARQAVPEPTTNRKRELHQRRLQEHRKRRALQQRRINIQQHKNRISNIRSQLYKSGFIERALEDLEHFSMEGKHPYLRAYAAWELSLWYADQRSEEGARRCLKYLPVALQGETDSVLLRQAAILEAEAQEALGDTETAKLTISRALTSDSHTDLFLARANLEASDSARIEWINRTLQLHGLLRVSFDSSAGFPLLDSLKPERYDRERRSEPEAARVSVIIPVYNAEKMLPTALDSVLSQTWSNLEVLIVDDCSTDGTGRLVEDYAARDSRVRLVEAETNGGTYIARNLALQLATGEFVTTHDADDWSHPEKIQRQVQHLLHNPSIMGNASEQARATPELKISRRGKPGFYVFSNMSSFMFRRAPVMEAIGYWDRVRFGADGEFKQRVRKVFGEESVVNLQTGPLSFTRQSDSSLIENSVSSIYMPMGPRQEYQDSFSYFHSISDDLKYELLPARRPFAAPEPMWPIREPREGERRHFDVILASDFRFPGGTTSSNVEEIKAQGRMGLRTGLMHIPPYLSDPRTGVNFKIRDLLDSDRVQMLVSGEKVSCDTLIIRHPSSIRDQRQFMIDVEVKAANIQVIVNQTPKRDYGSGGVVAYTISWCEKHLQKHFDKPGVWHPIGPLVREALHRHHEEELEEITLADENWSNIIDVEEWKRDPRPERGRRPRIGRHSRDAPLKWPENRDELLAAYPASDDYEVHVLGGAKAPRDLLGGLPENWRVLEFGETHPRDFLSMLDVFVYYTHPDLVEAFGRAILEAMAVGVPVILPHDYREVFGEAAIYAKPSEVKETVDLLMSDPGYYELQVELACNYVEKHFGYTKHAERLGKQIHS